MKRIKVGIALITMFGLLLGTAGVASAKTTVHHAKMTQTTTKSTHHQAKSQAPKKTVHKSAKATKSITTSKLAKTKSQAKQTTTHLIHA